MSALNLLSIANALLSGKPMPQVAKAEGEDPDALQSDPRAQGGSPDPQQMGDARQEAQAGQQAGGAPGQGDGSEGGAPEPDGDENGGGNPDGDGDEPVAKAEILNSMRFLARSHGITPAEVAKAFSGLEGDPAISPDPLGKGQEYLEQIVTGMNSQGKILEAIAGAIVDMAKHTVSLQGEVAKALTDAGDAKSAAATAAAQIASLPRTAPALQAKGTPAEEIAKADAGSNPLTAEDLFQMALKPDCPLSPAQIAQASRQINYRAANRA